MVDINSTFSTKVALISFVAKEKAGSEGRQIGGSTVLLAYIRGLHVSAGRSTVPRYAAIQATINHSAVLGPKISLSTSPDDVPSNSHAIRHKDPTLQRLHQTRCTCLATTYYPGKSDVPSIFNRQTSKQ